MGLPGELYRRVAGWAEIEDGFWQPNASLFSQNIYNVWLAVECKFHEKPNVCSQRVLLKSDFNCEFLFVELNSIFAVTYVLKRTVKELDLKSIKVDKW